MKKTFLLFVAVIVAALQSQSVAQQPYKLTVDGKTTTVTLADIKKFWTPQMQLEMEELNKQCPMRMNEMVTMTSVKYQNNTVYCDLKLDVKSSEFSEAEKKELKDESGPALLEGLKEGLLQCDTSMMSRNEWMRLFRELNIKFIIRMLGSDGVLITSVTGNTANIH